MVTLGKTPELLLFGPFILNLRTSELRKSGIDIRLQEQSLKVLAMLLERPLELVTRDEIKARLWPNDTVVDFEYGINSTPEADGWNIRWFNPGGASQPIASGRGYNGEQSACPDGPRSSLNPIGWANTTCGRPTFTPAGSIV